MSFDLLKTSKALGDETRLAVYHYLGRSSNRPVGVQHLAEEFKLHPNAIRQHLSKLEEAGLVFSEPLRSEGSGRPKRLYRVKGALLEAAILPRDYKLLSEILLDFLSATHCSSEQVKAFGRSWGQKWISRQGVGKSPSLSTGKIEELIAAQFSSWGFDPQVVSSSEMQIDIRLNNCIFKEVVAFHPEIVCPLLHGILEGMLTPWIGEHHSALENGIAHGENSCRVFVTLKEDPGLTRE